jgi:hypothetical protein
MPARHPHVVMPGGHGGSRPASLVRAPTGDTARAHGEYCTGAEQMPKVAEESIGYFCRERRSLPEPVRLATYGAHRSGRLQKRWIIDPVSGAFPRYGCPPGIGKRLIRCA